MAILPSLAHLEKLPGAVEVIAPDELSADMRETILRAGNVRGASGRYLAAWAPPANVDPEFEEIASIGRWDSLDDLQRYQTEKRITHLQVIDCHLLAEVIFDQVGGPVFRLEIEASE